MKILFLDIETSPNLAYVWGLFQQNVPIGNMVNSSTTLCYSAKWFGEKDIYFDSVYKSSPKKMLAGIHKLIDQADVVVTYNGIRFDLPTLNKEFLLHDMAPPAPYKQVDMLRVARKRFRFTSNKLDYVAQQLKLGGKTKHHGFQLWVDCLADDPEAWETMEKYNKNDVVLLEKVYLKMLPWIDNHPNRATYDESATCPNCGGKEYQRRGFAVTRERKYRRYQCLSCATWFRGTQTVTDKATMKFARV